MSLRLETSSVAGRRRRCGVCALRPPSGHDAGASDGRSHQHQHWPRLNGAPLTPFSPLARASSPAADAIFRGDVLPHVTIPSGINAAAIAGLRRPHCPRCSRTLGACNSYDLGGCSMRVRSPRLRCEPHRLFEADDTGCLRVRAVGTKVAHLVGPPPDPASGGVASMEEEEATDPGSRAASKR